MKTYVRRSIVHLLCIVLILSSFNTVIFSVGIINPIEVSAALVGADIKQGDTLELKSGEWEEEYIVLDPEHTNTGEDGTLLLQKEYGENTRTIFDKSGLENKWENSAAQQWCTQYYDALPQIIKDSVIGVETNESESGYDNAGINNIDGTRRGSDASKDKVFFLSSFEYLKYSETINILSPYKWWLRAPGIDCSEYHDYACVVMENGRILPYGVGYLDDDGSEKLGHPARPAFNIDIPDDVNATKRVNGGETVWSLDMDEVTRASDPIEIGDHVIFGKEDAKAYTGKPYWRVIDKDSAGNVYFLSEYLWLGDGRSAETNVSFNKNTSKGNEWKGSDADKWCADFKMDVLDETRGMRIKQVTFMSESEATKYLPDNKSRMSSLPPEMTDGMTQTWWLSTPEDNTTNQVRVVLGKYGIISKNSVNSGNATRPLVIANVEQKASLSKNNDGDWIISSEEGSEQGDSNGEEEDLQPLSPDNMVSVSEVKEGEHIYMGDDNAVGFDGVPYWRVLEKNSDGSMLLMSEYLWRSDESGSGLFSFNKDRTKLNAWQGSDAQKWCKDFESEVLNKVDGLTVKSTTKSDAEYTSPDKESIVFLESQDILNSEKVFYMSAEEVVKYMPQKADRIAYVPDGKKTRAESWWLRSPRKGVGAIHCVGRVFSYGSLEKNFVDYLGAGRPAMWVELSADTLAYKDGEDYLILEDGEDPRYELRQVKSAINGKEESGSPDGPSDEERKEETAETAEKKEKATVKTSSEKTVEGKSPKRVVITTKLPRISVKSTKRAKKSCLVKWKKLSKKKQKKIQGIEIQYSRNKAFTKNVKTKVIKKTKASAKIKKLKSKKQYWVRIRTYKKVGGIKYVSKWSKAKRVKAK